MPCSCQGFALASVSPVKPYLAVSKASPMQQKKSNLSTASTVSRLEQCLVDGKAKKINHRNNYFLCVAPPFTRHCLSISLDCHESLLISTLPQQRQGKGPTRNAAFLQDLPCRLQVLASWKRKAGYLQSTENTIKNLHFTECLIDGKAQDSLGYISYLVPCLALHEALP